MAVSVQGSPPGKRTLSSWLLPVVGFVFAALGAAGLWGGFGHVGSGAPRRDRAAGEVS